MAPAGRSGPCTESAGHRREQDPAPPSRAVPRMADGCTAGVRSMPSGRGADVARAAALPRVSTSPETSPQQPGHASPSRQPVSDPPRVEIPPPNGRSDLRRSPTGGSRLPLIMHEHDGHGDQRCSVIARTAVRLRRAQSRDAAGRSRYPGSLRIAHRDSHPRHHRSTTTTRHRIWQGILRVLPRDI